MNIGHYRYTEQEIRRNLRETNIYEESEIEEILTRLDKGQRIIGPGKFERTLDLTAVSLFTTPIFYSLIRGDKSYAPLIISGLLFTSYFLVKKLYNKLNNFSFLIDLEITMEHQRQIMSGRPASNEGNNQGLDKLLGGPQ